MPDRGTHTQEAGAKELATLLYLIERAVSHGNAEFDIEDAWYAYESALREARAE